MVSCGYLLSCICYNIAMKKLKNLSLSRGFTLIELLVVIIIISILTGIIVANLAQSKAKARDAKRVSDVTQLSLALELYFDRCNQYLPTGILTPQAALTTGCGTVTFGNFISTIPTPPPGSAETAYITVGGKYATFTNNTDYHLGVTLETTNSALQDKANFQSATSLGPVSGWTNGFDGTNPLIYDVRPK